MTAVLAGALFLTIGLLGTALFQLRGEVRSLGDALGAKIDGLGGRITVLERDLSAQIADIRVGLARIEQKLDDHIADPAAHAG